MSTLYFMYRKSQAYVKIITNFARIEFLELREIT